METQRGACRRLDLLQDPMGFGVAPYTLDPKRGPALGTSPLDLMG